MKRLKLFKEYSRILETISPENFHYYQNEMPSFIYRNVDAFEKALMDYDGSFEPNDKPWGDIIEISNKKYIMSEYGNDYMIFINLADPDDGYTIYYTPVTSNRGTVTSPFTFKSIEVY